MSRSNATENARNPSTRWFEWKGGDDGGFVSWYDKDAKKRMDEKLPFTFLLLDELGTVKGWHDASSSGIFANEVRDTRQQTLLVRSFKGGELASGLYASIRDRINALGGGYHASCYLGYKDGAELKIGNINFGGIAMKSWMDFKKNCPTVKGPDGKSVKAYYAQAVRITGYTEGKKGKITFRAPVFALAETTPETNQQAVALDAELQAFLNDYFHQTKTEQVATVAPTPFHDDDLPSFTDPQDNVPDDVPF